MVSKLKKVISTGDSGILLVTIVMVNAGNYAINLFLGRILGPEDFAEAGLLATGILVLSFFALGFQMTAAKYTATYSVADSPARQQTFSRWFNRQSMMVGLGLASLLAISSWGLKNYLHFRSVTPFLLIAAGIPVYLLMSTGRGILQGEMKFKKLAGSYLLEMIVRLSLTAVIIGSLLYWGGAWITEGVALGFLASFFAAYWISRAKTGTESVKFPFSEQKQIFGFMFIIGSYELSQIMISHSDVILVKHYFSNEEAGLYTALALIGRVVFFATWSVVTLLFPKVVQREKMGLPHQKLFYQSLLLVMAIGVLITFGCYFFSDWIVYLLFGEAFASISKLLWMYASATTLFACANVFAYYYLSLNKYTPVILSGITGIMQIALIILFHNSITTIILVQIILMASLFLGMVLKPYKKNQVAPE